MLLKAILIGIFCYLGSLSTPWILGTTGGWYTLTRPLVSGMIVGLILGDVQKGILIGVAVQAVYIALITPGGTMPADLNFVAYPAIALGVLSGADPKVAVTLAATIGIAGTIVFNFMMVLNSVYAHMGDRFVEKGDFRGIVLVNAVYPQITNFLLRFIPSFIAVYFGAPYIQHFVTATPKVVIDIMSVLGGMLPAVGIGILLKQVVKDVSLLAFFAVGFIAVVFLKLNMVALAMLGIAFAVMHYKYSSSNKEAIENEQ
ncbi:PTS mannose/fructose/sorbose/N-acetylgalactosamine transporter subunit IIC [Thermoanaerobacter wiegelii]|uniref:Phosphotransferase system PTS sorbose-specific IIC subunit n=1 Tax=Thermoanaerobacter wiegelii Rt8.B1 TaxID=697303 RepID=G2MTU8_9THEO|nr:PTS sugar transporter subunit IIC [Thermoanaerobacter wiegelii]AEM79483.1 phosphotransferase system PTS sorbose-specific IIC subunit [Thermoanaerobacter wiegelii Rt8.B1]